MRAKGGPGRGLGMHLHSLGWNEREFEAGKEEGTGLFHHPGGGSSPRDVAGCLYETKDPTRRTHNRNNPIHSPSVLPVQATAIT